MMPIDAREHILKNAEVEAYRYPDLETSEDSPRGLGPIDPWLDGQTSVARLEKHYAVFTPGSLRSSERIVVFPHSPKVRGGRS